MTLVPIPLVAVSHQLIVNIPSPNGSAQTSGPGAPEVVFPFLIENDDYTGSGVATGSVDGHRIIAGLEGSLVPMPAVNQGGSLRVELRSVVRMTVPDFGFPTTPVALRVQALDAVIGGGFENLLGWAEPPTSYSSEILGARVLTPPFGTEFGQNVFAGQAVLGSFLAGDVVELRVEVHLSAGGFNLLGGTLDGETVVELLAVPEPSLGFLLVATAALPALGRARRA